MSYSSPEFEFNTRFGSSDLTLKQRKGKFYINHVNCCGVSIAIEQQRNQDLKRIHKREYEFSNSHSSLFTRMHCILLCHEQQEDVAWIQNENFYSDFIVKRCAGDRY